jgi:hypothetical protein
MPLYLRPERTFDARCAWLLHVARRLHRLDWVINSGSILPTLGTMYHLGYSNQCEDWESMRVKSARHVQEARGGRRAHSGMRERDRKRTVNDDKR